MPTCALVAELVPTCALIGYYCFYCRIGREVRANRSSIPSRDYVFPARQRNLKGGWVNLGSGLRIDAYSGKFKEHNGPDSDPASQDIDATIFLQSGDGKKGGRLYVGDGAIRKKDIPKLSHLRATTSSSGPAIEHRPQPGLHMLHQLEVSFASSTFLVISSLYCNDGELVVMAYCRPMPGFERRKP